MFIPLPPSFYEPPAKEVARSLLGHWLIRNTGEGPVGGPIVEAEAYCVGDPACHAYLGETKRNRAMWGPHGRAYVYLIYGFYYCFNAVCRPAGQAEAVLVRAVEPRFGEDFMRGRRPGREFRDLTSGPGKLCAAMEIDRGLDQVDLCDVASPVFIAANQEVKKYRRRSGPVITTTRIGITQGADLPLRFYLDGSDSVSKRVPGRRLAPVSMGQRPM